MTALYWHFTRDFFDLKAARALPTEARLVVLLRLVVALVLSPAFLQRGLLLPRLVNPVPVLLERFLVRRP
ncbi:Hypothetical protein PHPALM_7214 [Phytophthora palmivora]|uniref:Uncharacterized protein n=1 Tax=Phytophthora palmivora TaxID=4796 RepID=A0A2P4YCW9_9STRA|nr:Hypothetical protein PHPALM_7214 [Phytophthora palmivora]